MVFLPVTKIPGGKGSEQGRSPAKDTKDEFTSAPASRTYFCFLTDGLADERTLYSRHHQKSTFANVCNTRDHLSEVATFIYLRFRESIVACEYAALIGLTLGTWGGKSILISHIDN
jgi:hypothetical protein